MVMHSESLSRKGCLLDSSQKQLYSISPFRECLRLSKELCSRSKNSPHLMIKAGIQWPSHFGQTWDNSSWPCLLPVGTARALHYSLTSPSTLFCFPLFLPLLQVLIPRTLPLKSLLHSKNIKWREWRERIERWMEERKKGGKEGERKERNRKSIKNKCKMRALLIKTCEM